MPKNRIFEIVVDANGKFTYLPPNPTDLGNQRWDYMKGDNVQFVCNKGPFEVKYVRVQASTGALLPDRVSPFGRVGGNLLLTVGSTTLDAGKFKTESMLIDPVGHSPEEIQAEVNASGTVQGVTMVALYKYLVHVGEGPTATVDFSRNGMWRH